MAGALDGVRIIDLTHVLNGPFCTVLLAHMGADVIKIEHGSGDRFRHGWMSPDADHDGYEFLVVNANKRGVSLNLKTEKGKEIFRRLVATADVVVENFSRGVLDRLGLGYEALKEMNPRIIYAHAKGFGDSGPAADVRANAQTIMAATGWTKATWDFAHVEGFQPQGPGDEMAGISMALGIVSALYEREHSGLGQKIEISMQEALLGLMVSNFHMLYEKQHVGAPAKPCADGYIAIHLPDMPQPLWEALARGLGHSEAIDDPRFATVELRQRNYPDVEAAFTEWVRDFTRGELYTLFMETGAPAWPVMSLAEVVEDEHLKARGAFVEVEDPRSGTVNMLAPWIRFERTPSAIRRTAPRVGEDNVEVYSELLNLNREEIEQLTAEGVL